MTMAFVKRAGSSLTVAIGADHGGFALKARLRPVLERLGCVVADLGTHSPARCDYPLVGYRVAAAVAAGRFDRGILICKSGIGISIVANKVPGIRAALCEDVATACLSRAHNDANILVLGAERISSVRARAIVEAWCAAPFEGGRHARRVHQIAAIERKIARARGRLTRGDR